MSAIFSRRQSQTVLVLSEQDRTLLKELIEVSRVHRTLPAARPDPARSANQRRWDFVMRWGKVVGGALAVVSLVLVALQTRDAASSAKASAQAAKATAWGAATQAVLTFDQTALQADPGGKLDPYFSGGALLGPRTPHATRSKVTDLAGMELDLIDGYRGFTDILGNFVDKNAVRGWQQITYQRGPAICQVMNYYRQSYAADFVRDATYYCPHKLLQVAGRG
jgi:hypothetical protein